MTKYTINKEGTPSIFIALSFGAMLLYASWVMIAALWISALITAVILTLIIWVIFFFRVPVLDVRANPGEIISSADGKVVAVEQVEHESFPDNMAWQVSVFMSPFDTHMNRYPVAGKVTGVEYQKGKFLPAYNPKASDENERNTVKMVSDDGQTIWIRQIAGILARRIVNYARQNTGVYAGQPLGFIKFGSRVDHFLPATAKIKVDINTTVSAGKTVIAELARK
ncbi:MAG: phosphatidylserine decarboxylase family protein [Bacteroidales bacterium]|nr:phosphatidylserine decarboxylase family protein [Bacteroidales bacterium]MCF8327362.1 phosphatidylserine decarboxylase family protein [Bacteroidales bacterium]